MLLSYMRNNSYPRTSSAHAMDKWYDRTEQEPSSKHDLGDLRFRVKELEREQHTVLTHAKANGLSLQELQRAYLARFTEVEAKMTRLLEMEEALAVTQAALEETRERLQDVEEAFGAYLDGKADFSRPGQVVPP